MKKNKSNPFAVFGLVLSIGLLIISLTSCGKKLTKDNYYNYLQITGNISGGEIYDNHFSEASGTIYVKGLSDIYDYSKISLVARVDIETQYDSAINEKNVQNRVYSIDVPVELNVNGDGSSDFVIDFESYYEAIKHETMGPIAKKEPGQYSKYYPIIVNVNAELNSIKGRLK